MLFNSIEFVLFFPIVFLLYWGIFNRHSARTRNLFLLVISYLFYGWWDYRFLGLIILSSLVDYWCGNAIYRSSRQSAKRFWLVVSLSVNLGVLFFFKYYGFFIQELATVFSSWGYALPTSTLKIILPVGISFYTFQTLSYTIDIYRQRISPTNDPVAFFAFVSFFPQLVAGPIERARHLLPQFNKLKKFDRQVAVNGFRQLLWGFFAKIAVADSVAPIVDSIFAHHTQATAATLLLGAVLFSIQIFCDFAGYSNIAIGTAALLGFDLMQNFNMPYFSRNIREFWTRWHISLSTWFRDYIYIPLGGNRCSKAKHALNIMLTFIISGLWHGANWTFLVWGALHGFLYLITKPFSRSNDQTKPELQQLPAILTTFLLVCFAFIFFRAENIGHAYSYLSRMFSFTSNPFSIKLITNKQLAIAFFFTLSLLITEWVQRDKKHGLDLIDIKPVLRYGIYYLVIGSILFSFQTDRIFIYFQF
ncbi:MBOAT family O-acyltransferase [Sunxiuqinia elliptica]|uniref:D-alanyl-lipoteichoic acid acyltransferase DltB (MBOAT superfamily) n=1 Tax=Sunxiuqinia elliptica TaxID=655355 RepID=A0A4V3BYQ0_9BACT|nr:MBOAT family O-acyltransferase [Sunxiuqinia elliptica]TDO03389.1 D-alanyl-lipoteichoic acid acyltransferase DltB (MBOAT superfamily) [Sunxiuqinia elliptica]TDO59586.1 D-alanyl-lipoteichoic acid acyltransferase DltB (MBOAT superfamily) [Sunxiuqinia elliptica]